MRFSYCATKYRKVHNMGVLSIRAANWISFLSICFAFRSRTVPPHSLSPFPLWSRWHRGAILLRRRLGGQRLLLPSRRPSPGGHCFQNAAVLQHLHNRVGHCAHAAAAAVRSGSERTNGFPISARRQGLVFQHWSFIRSFVTVTWHLWLFVFAPDPYGYNEKKRRRENLMKMSGLSSKTFASHLKWSEEECPA